jgi:hypothetical protein
MRYKFRKLDLWEELKVAVGDKPAKVTDSGHEIIFDFGDTTLTPTQEKALIELMANKPLLRGKLAKFVEKGPDVTVARPERRVETEPLP